MQSQQGMSPRPAGVCGLRVWVGYVFGGEGGAHRVCCCLACRKVSLCVGRWRCTAAAAPAHIWFVKHTTDDWVGWGLRCSARLLEGPPHSSRSSWQGVAPTKQPPTRLPLPAPVRRRGGHLHGGLPQAARKARLVSLAHPNLAYCGLPFSPSSPQQEKHAPMLDGSTKQLGRRTSKQPRRRCPAGRTQDAERHLLVRMQLGSWAASGAPSGVARRNE